MVSVNIRVLTHNFSRYLKEVKSGEKIVIMERNTPIADLIPHNKNVAQPGWKREIKKLYLKGEPFSHTIIKARKGEKY